MSVRITSTSTTNRAYCYRNITGAAIAPNSTALSMGGWFKVKTWSAYNPLQCITNQLDRDFCIEQYTTGGGSSPDTVKTATNSVGVDSTRTIATDVWKYVAFSRPAGGGSGTAFVGTESDGALTQNTGVDMTGLGSNALNHVVLGALAAVDLVTNFNGEWEHFRVFTRELSNADWIANRDSTTPVGADCYLAWSGVDATDTADISGNGRTWTAVTNGTGTVTNGASNSPPGAYSAGGGTITLTVQDSTHGHAVDNVVLSPGLSLAVQDALHGHAVDSITLTGIRFFSFALKGVDGVTPAASLTGLKWVWWPTIAAMFAGSAADAHGSGATTDGSGVFTAEAPSGLSAGTNQGFGVISNQDATPDSTEAAYVGSFDVT
jgi:hypothetical protein